MRFQVFHITIFNLTGPFHSYLSSYKKMASLCSYTLLDDNGKMSKSIILRRFHTVCLETFADVRSFYLHFI